eukprot:7259035-Prymnesium_polylepis.1
MPPNVDYSKFDAIVDSDDEDDDYAPSPGAPQEDGDTLQAVMMTLGAWLEEADGIALTETEHIALMRFVAVQHAGVAAGNEENLVEHMERHGRRTWQRVRRSLASLCFCAIDKKSSEDEAEQ